MPRADPTRSAYCASRHLLRNLDNATELRRNPLARSYFASAPPLPRRDADRQALARIRGVVYATLGACSEHAGHARRRADLGRMHAALLRCELDKQRLSVVAVELSLSERQLRRERRAAHDAFACAFRRAEQSPLPASTSGDLAALRLAEAVELHELAQTDLALGALASVATGASSPGRRIEALCLAAEVELDGVGYAAAAAHLAAANAILVLHADALDERERVVATEHVQFAEWLLRWQTATSCGIATPPPIAAASSGATSVDERRRALFVRAAAAYAAQRCEVGDANDGVRATGAALAVLPSLNASRAKERLAALFADAQVFGLRAPPGEDRERFLAVEKLAHKRGYRRTTIAARVERIGSDVFDSARSVNVFANSVPAYGAFERRTMTRTLASAARIAAQTDRDVQRCIAAAALAEELAPARSAANMLSRCMRVKNLAALGRYEEGRELAHDIRSDADAVGNGRLRGAAARYLAVIALERSRRAEALHHIGEALQLLERYGTVWSFEQAQHVARRLRVN